MSGSGEEDDAPWPLEDVTANTRRLLEEAHAAGAGSDPEALPELPPEAGEAASPGPVPEETARLMDEAFGRAEAIALSPNVLPFVRPPPRQP